MMELIGLTAAFCTTFSFVPQVVQIYRTRLTQGISLGMYIIFSLGVALWLIYGILMHSPSLVIANSITLILALSVLIMKIKWRNPVVAQMH